MDLRPRWAQVATQCLQIRDFEPAKVCHDDQVCPGQLIGQLVDCFRLLTSWHRNSPPSSLALSPTKHPGSDRPGAQEGSVGLAVSSSGPRSDIKQRKRRTDGLRPGLIVGYAEPAP